MDQVIDFTHAEPGLRDYGGSDSKKSVIYNGEHYMLKFADEKQKINSLATSTSNSVFSEYVGSHVVASLGLPTHDTILGLYEDEPVVACKDFVERGEKLQEFDWFLRTMYRKSEIGRVPTYNQIYGTIENSPILKNIKDKAIARYWDTFIADALIGNFDRHKGNWGYLVNEEERTIRLAPIYDCGSSLYPGLAEKSFGKILSSREEIDRRLYDFPKTAILKTDDIHHAEKFSYQELLNSDYDYNCLCALARIAPNIDMNKINEIIDNTPIISEERKQFYKEMLQERKEHLLDKALEIHLEKGNLHYEEKTPEFENEEVPMQKKAQALDDDLEL